MLTAEQIQYGANDVRYLLAWEERLRRALTGTGRADIYERCCTSLPTRVELELGEYPDVFTY